MPDALTHRRVPPALIAAAGGGKRLLPMTADRPKCMLEVGGEPILIHQIRALQACGVSQIQLIVGHGEESVRAACAALDHDGISFARNERHATTNSLFSFGCTTLDPYPDGLLVLNSDVLFHPTLLRRLIDNPRENVLLADLRSRLGEEEMKICLDTDFRIRRISKLVDPLQAQAENLGVLKLGPETASRMLRLARADGADTRLCWIPDAIDFLAGEIDFFALGSGELPWIEIDYPHDLRRAREEIWPQIQQGSI
ncbi:MAG TPA: phosphocholine cytidylyltransferase family protein [Candidatus Sumerlaeota bacterium]|nr:MAG: Bifunctional protein GlmU [candidate division BRC1 bacterium ADurb.BinA292]HOR27805.1 phosphocholine cytidylyltransferase family protein [Candidatus Sumerlaeota bacterium]HPK02545.1 phosphocholine cytidylyltransferase family protein [Candidatus Sumerlaeota bacterium]